MMYTCISLIVHPPFEIPGSAPGLLVKHLFTLIHATHDNIILVSQQGILYIYYVRAVEASWPALCGK